MNSLLRLYKEMKQDMSTKEELEVALADAEISFPIGCKVAVLGTGYLAEVVDYNRRLGGFYPGVRYPVIVKIFRSKDRKFRKVVGMKFEYSTGQLKRLKVKVNV